MRRVLLFGVVNASPDSLNEDSIAATPAEADARARSLLADGADAIDIGAQGSTDLAGIVDWRQEWRRAEAVLPALVALGVDVSIDTWQPQVAWRALAAGATVLNAADGMQADEMWQVAADFEVAVVVPFLTGPNPRRMTLVHGDPVRAMLEFFEARLADADRFGLRRRCLLDPGTGFAPPDWPWEQRYTYQRHVYSHLDELRCFDLPLYVALPWKQTPQHDELLDIALAQRPEYGRAHYPAKVRSVERALALADE